MIEHAIQAGLFSQQKEKTFIDKLLAKEQVEQLRILIKKSPLTREDLLEILYLISGNEAKLVNYSTRDRFVILKFFVWIREFVKVTELVYDYRENLEKKNVKLSKEAEQIFSNIQRLLEHNIKFLVDLYLNIARTSLSVGATGILEILKNKFEINYPGAASINNSQENKTGFLGMGRG